LVWREIHKQDFIKTILLGYPCPQIFISRGDIDVEKMETTSCVVDGQQRLDAIGSYIDGQFSVDGRFYQGLSGDEKADFLKYELAVIELDLGNNDPRVKEIFQRLNRTANSLTAIEKLASEYAPSQYMLVASHLAGELKFDSADDEDATFRIDPAIDRSFFEWADQNSTPRFTSLYQEMGVFRSNELSRKVHLMHILNLVTTLLEGFFNRNVRTRAALDAFAEVFNEKDAIVPLLEGAAGVVLDMGLDRDSYWLNKASLFSILYAVAESLRNGNLVNAGALREGLQYLEAELPDSYRQAANQCVNYLAERRARHAVLMPVVNAAATPAA